MKTGTVLGERDTVPVINCQLRLLEHLCRQRGSWFPVGAVKAPPDQKGRRMSMTWLP